MNRDEDRYVKIFRIVTKKHKGILVGDKAISEELLNQYIDEIHQVIINYCSIPCVPVALDYTWANMVVDACKFQMEQDYTPEDAMDAIDPSDLSSVKVGDTSIFIGDKYRSNTRSRILQSHNANLDDIVYNYRQQLNQFRKLW